LPPPISTIGRCGGAVALLTRSVAPSATVISDDGLQHPGLPRATEVAVFDRRGAGNGRLLPAGPLREPPERLAGVALVVQNGAGALRHPGAVVLQLVPGALRPAGPSDAALPLASLAGQRVHAVAGIGHPERFFRTLRAAGLEVIPHAFPDHHAFTAADLAFDDDLPILMTEKDAVKCAPFASSRLGYVPVTATFGDEDARALLALVGAKIAAAARGR